MTKKSKKTIRTRVLLQRILNAIKNSFPESANKDKIALLCVFFKGISASPKPSFLIHFPGHRVIENNTQQTENRINQVKRGK